MKARPLRRRFALLTAAAFPWGAGGCSAPEKKPTAAEWLRENTIILEQLRSYDRKERELGIHRFLKLGKEQGTEVVTYLLDDPKLDDYRIEVVLASILAQWRDSRAIPFLLQHLRGPDRGAVGIARNALAVFGSEPRVLAAARELLDDPEAPVRGVGAGLLSEMRSPEAAEALAGRYRVEEDRELRADCLLGIITSRHPRRRALLTEALEDRETEIRAAAWEALLPEKPPARFDPAGSPASRARALAALKRWAGHEGPSTSRGRDSGNP